MNPHNLHHNKQTGFYEHLLQAIALADGLIFLLVRL